MDSIRFTYKNRISNWFGLSVLIFYLIVAWQSSGFNHPDEHFQIIEFANYKLGKAKLSDLAWEYNAHIRSGLQPALCYVIFEIAQGFGLTDPYKLAFILRALTAILAILVIKNFVSSSLNSIGNKYQWAYILLSYLLWFLPYINVRFSSEAWSGIFILLAFTIIQNDANKSKFRPVLLGIVFGVSFLFRYQSALLVLGIVFWLIFVRKIKFPQLMKIGMSGFAILIVGLFIDWWLYGQITFTVYNYFYVNIIKNVASNYGVSPWYKIILYIIDGPGPLGIFILLAYIILLIRRPKHIILWSTIPFLLTHIIIPHKELRFLFPIANLIPLLLILAFQESIKFISLKKFKFIYLTILIGLIITNIAGLIVISTKGAGNTKVSATEYIHRRYAHQKVNVIYLKGTNPYSDWPFPRNTFYNSRAVVLTPIVTIWQHDLANKTKKDFTNLLVIPNEAIIGSRTAELLIKHNFVQVFQSIPWIDQQIINFYNNSLNNDNLIIYEFKD